MCQDNEKVQKSKSDELTELTKTLRSLANNVETVANHLIIKKRWYQNISIRDITLIIGLLVFVFTVFEFRDTYTKFQQRSRMVQSIANTALRLSQDLAFRPSGADVKQQVIDSLLKDARDLAPQDPDLLSVQIYSQFMRKARNPQKDDLMLMDAYINFINRLRKVENERSIFAKAFEFKQEQIITPGRFLQKLYYVGAAAFLNYIDKNKVDLSFQSLLFSKTDEYLLAGIKISQEEKDDIYESVLWAMKVEHGLMGINLGKDYDEQIRASLQKAETLFARFKKDKRKERQLTGYDGIANINYLKGKYMHKTGNKKEAIKYLNESLRCYDALALKFPEKINTAEVQNVKNYLHKIKSDG